MTSTRFQYPTRLPDRRAHNRGERPAPRPSRPRRTGMVSEAVVASYIRELATHGSRMHGAAGARAERRQEAGL
jgi:hypothetical protein